LSGVGDKDPSLSNVPSAWKQSEQLMEGYMWEKPFLPELSAPLFSLVEAVLRLSFFFGLEFYFF
jgi:hypothetical protein